MNNRVFISYSREDTESARRLYKDLRNNGINVWIDTENLLPGQNYNLEVKRAIRNSDYVIALVSSRSLSKKGYVQKELRMSLNILDEMPEGEIFIIPVRLDQCEIPYGLEQYHFVDLFIDYESGLKRILRALSLTSDVEVKTETSEVEIKTDEIVFESDEEKGLIELSKKFFGSAGYNRIRYLSNNCLEIRSDFNHNPSVVFTWTGEKRKEKIIEILKNKIDTNDYKKYYLIHTGSIPSSDDIYTFRKQTKSLIIPVYANRMDKSLNSEDEDDVLREIKNIEEPFTIRSDPYADFKPINDPTWFYGRHNLIKKLKTLLSQGHHVGVFGLRRVGKTSLIKQFQQRFLSTLTVYIDCQAFSYKAEYLFNEILRQLTNEIRYKIQPTVDEDDFRKQFLDIYDIWKATGHHEPFLIIFDEIDKLFPNRELSDSKNILSEYVRLFKMLRGLAQAYDCIVTLVTAYRPYINRHNILSPEIGENPMFKNFKEEYLGYLDLKDSTDMIQEIGGWSEIYWDRKAAEKAFFYCGGHPLISRYFASYATNEGRIKEIDLNIVEKTANRILKTFRKNDFGDYYKEGIWAYLDDNERKVLEIICRSQDSKVSEESIINEFEEELTNLERFNLVVENDNYLKIRSSLFQSWLIRSILK